MKESKEESRRFHGTWESEDGTEFETTVTRFTVGHGMNDVGLMISFAGNWGHHAMPFREGDRVKVTVEKVTE